MERVRRRVIVHGHVQGVFFRETTRRRAEAVFDREVPTSNGSTSPPSRLKA
jgi:hypothetical protein